jgi:hypothetical protein
MVNLDLCCITLGTTNTWHFHSPTVWYNSLFIREPKYPINEENINLSPE